MTDRELSTFGERLYSAILAARLSEPAMRDLAQAIEDRRPWTHLGKRSKISIFVVAAQFERVEAEATSGISEADTPPDESPSEAECEPPARAAGNESVEALPNVNADESPPSADALDLQALQDVLEADEAETPRAAVPKSAAEPPI